MRGDERRGDEKRGDERINRLYSNVTRKVMLNRACTK
jgi:hypothetical protein